MSNKKSSIIEKSALAIAIMAGLGLVALFLYNCYKECGYCDKPAVAAVGFVDGYFADTYSEINSKSFAEKAAVLETAKENNLSKKDLDSEFILDFVSCSLLERNIASELIEKYLGKNQDGQPIAWKKVLLPEHWVLIKNQMGLNPDTDFSIKIETFGDINKLQCAGYRLVKVLWLYDNTYFEGREFDARDQEAIKRWLTEANDILIVMSLAKSES